MQSNRISETLEPGSFPAPIRTRRRFSALLTATALGIYLLLIVGATTSLTDAASTCSSWPICTTPADPLSQTQLAIAWGHRITALVVGILVVATALASWYGDVTRRVRIGLLIVSGLYLVQIAVGAVTATIGPAAIVPGLHLTLGILIFTIVVLALAWDLETVTESIDSASSPDEDIHDTDPSTATANEAPTPSITGQQGIGDVAVDARPPPTDEVTISSDQSNTSDSTTTSTLTVRGKRTLGAYFSMMKPRLMWLLCLVAAAGMALAAGPALDTSTIVATLTGGVLAIGASGTFNHVLERDVDRRMARTADRPLATDVVPVGHAIVFGFVLTIASLAVFLTINALAAALGLAAILFYSVVYTLLLKPHTVQNTVIGGAAGALPALIGWAAVTNEIGLPALALAGVIFLWTPAHFYNLALAYRDDYASGGFPMLPVVRGEAVTMKHIIYYIGATLVGTIALAWLTDLGALFVATVVAFGGLFLWMAVTLHFERTESAAFRTFHASNAFLGAVLVAVVVDALVL